MTNAENSERIVTPLFIICVLSLFRHSSFAIRHSPYVDPHR